MECVALDFEPFHLGIADLDPFLIGSGINCALDFKAGFCRRGGDQLDDGHAIGERPAPPVLRNVTEHAVLDPIPFRRAGRIVADLDCEPRLVCKLLQLDFPEPHARAV
jgi:hypothetical protein